MFAVVTAVDKYAVGGVGEQRRGNREDTRDKAALVITKRCAVALQCVARLMIFPRIAST